MPWELKNDRQIWQQISDILTQRIVSGEYPSGVRIPSVRELAAEAGVNPNTMQRALANLEDSGLVSAQRNTGRFVTEDGALIGFMRLKLAKAELESFQEKMEKLGFTMEEAEQLLSKKEELQ